jgi:hypothetical protein
VRTAPVVLAAEAVRARLAAGLEGGNRQLVGSVLRRADEPGEMLAYWTSRYGRAVPKPVKRGIADAVARLYDERAFLRYDSDARGFRFGDVIDLVHPSPAPARTAWQGELFRLPQLGFMAGLRNLRNLDEAGLTDEDVAPLVARLSDPEQVRRSRQFPFRFLSAYLSGPSLRWGHALKQALDAATANIPELPGRTLILIDTSASMAQPMSRKSAMTMVQAAALFGLATAIRNRDRTELYGFAGGQFRMRRPGPPTAVTTG